MSHFQVWPYNRGYNEEARCLEKIPQIKLHLHLLRTNELACNLFGFPCGKPAFNATEWRVILSFLSLFYPHPIFFSFYSHLNQRVAKSRGELMNTEQTPSDVCH